MTHAYIDQLDAAVFSSDMLHSYDNRRDLRRAMESWIRAIDSHEELNGLSLPTKRKPRDPTDYELETVWIAMKPEEYGRVSYARKCIQAYKDMNSPPPRGVASVTHIATKDGIEESVMPHERIQTAIDVAAAYARGHDAGWASCIGHVTDKLRSLKPLNPVESRAAKSEESSYIQDASPIDPPSNFGNFDGAPAASPTVVEPEPVAWRYQDSRGHYRYCSYKPGFDTEYAILKPVPLYLAATPPRAALTDEQAEALIESSDGRWHEDEFRIDSRDLMALLRKAHGIAASEGGAT